MNSIRKTIPVDRRLYFVGATHCDKIQYLVVTFLGISLFRHIEERLINITLSNFLTGIGAGVRIGGRLFFELVPPILTSLT